MIPFTHDDLVRAARRELALRRNVYPRWVANGKMKQDKANDEIALMEAVLDLLEEWPAVTEELRVATHRLGEAVRSNDELATKLRNMRARE